ncbi:hypothetical protein ABH942_003329 [Flavobacterium sp. 28YEA47A]|uniref:hypothetical protein n=1 Tax=Flavobacterium sp. 28YEA47A TaxID=3156276 RepID=UPI003514E56A
MENIKSQIEALQPKLPVSMIQLPDGENLNTMWRNYGTDGIQELLNNPTGEMPSSLEIIDNYKISYRGKTAVFVVMGQLPMDLGNLRISMHIVEKLTQKKHRLKIDLYDFMNVQNQCRELSEKQGFDYNRLEADLIVFTDLLEEYRESLFKEEINPVTDQYSEKELTPRAGEKAAEFLSKDQLLQNIDALLEQAGIIGEQNNRKILFVVASSYKMPYPLHAMVQASSGSGKSHLINSIAECMPQDELFDTTSITSKSLYYCSDKQLNNKLLVIQDFDGLDDDAKFALREIQSFKKLKRTTIEKTITGSRKSVKREVKASLASLIATTKTEIYQDNESRTIMLGIDESIEQTMRIIQGQNKKKAGATNSEKEHEAKQLLRNCMRVLKSYQVVNPYADKITLPLDAKMLRRLNEQFQDFICQITILHQYQRRADAQGRLIASKEDVRLAVEIFFDAIILKVDELNGSVRQFFDRLKEYVKKQPAGTTHRFTQREIRQEMKLSKTPANNCIKLLQEMEYIKAVEGSPNKGFRFIVSYWDNLEKLKANIKEDLNSQLEQL